MPVAGFGFGRRPGRGVNTGIASEKPIVPSNNSGVSRQNSGNLLLNSIDLRFDFGIFSSTPEIFAPTPGWNRPKRQRHFGLAERGLVLPCRSFPLSGPASLRGRSGHRLPEPSAAHGGRIEPTDAVSPTVNWCALKDRGPGRCGHGWKHGSPGGKPPQGGQTRGWCWLGSAARGLRVLGRWHGPPCLCHLPGDALRTPASRSC